MAGAIHWLEYRVALRMGCPLMAAVWLALCVQTAAWTVCLHHMDLGSTPVSLLSGSSLP